MIDLKRILVATDFSTFSGKAVQYGCAFAEQFGSELHLLHVLQDVTVLVPEPDLAFPSAEYQQELKAAAEGNLASLVSPEWEEGKTVVRATRFGVPFLEIVRYAKDHDVDLILVGTHGRSGLAHVLLGSVAEKIVRKAPCPVLTVRDPEHEFVMP